MQWCDSTNKSPIKLNAIEIKLMNRENLQGKNPTGWFLSHHSQESIIINHKRLQV